MPQGLVIRDAQGNTKQIPFDQLQQADPFLYSKYVQNVAQPNAQLGETQASTNAAQASAGAAGASAAVSTAELPGAQAEAQLRQAQSKQLGIENKAGSYFESHKGNDGFVSPQDYNSQKAAYVQAGGDSGTFDNKFADNYINPKNIFYDTPDAKIARSTLPVIKNVVDSYRQLDKTGPVYGALSSVPYLGAYLQQNQLAAEKAHNDFLTGQAGNLRQIAGAGAGQGFRFNLQELSNITGMLPGAYDSKDLANEKLDRLNSFMQSNMGVGLKDLYAQQ